LEAVIWDMDGVLLDSRPSHFKAWDAIFEKYQMKANPRELRKTFGMTNQEVIQYIADESISADLSDRIGSEKDLIFQSFIRDQAVFLPGVKDWLERFRENGIVQALASSGSPGNIQVILAALGAEPYFECIVSGDGKPSKPDPFIFLSTADQLGKVPASCLVIEDSIAGVQAARAAVMKCAAVTTTNPAENLSAADVIYGRLTEMTTDAVQALFFNK
jgi:beta-phosphoglucomutase